MEILLGPHQVVVEGSESMSATAAIALKLWRDTTDTTVAGEATGFTMPAVISDPQPQPLMAPEIPLPYQLVPAQEDADDRR